MQSEATKLLEEQATLQQGLAMAVMEQRAAIARAEAAEEEVNMPNMAMYPSQHSSHSLIKPLLAAGGGVGGGEHDA